MADSGRSFMQIYPDNMMHTLILLHRHVGVMSFDVFHRRKVHG
jgi:hypothetical protein